MLEPCALVASACVRWRESEEKTGDGGAGLQTSPSMTTPTVMRMQTLMWMQTVMRMRTVMPMQTQMMTQATTGNWSTMRSSCRLA